MFLLQYQMEHEGRSPTIDLMIREMRAPEAAVRLLLQKLERVGHILIISRHPLRLIVKTAGFNPLAGRDVGSGSVSKFLDAEATRHRLGRYIGEVEGKTGRGPTLRQMMAYLQYNNAGWVNRAVEILAERGLVTAGNGMPTKLTALGRQFYGMKETKVQDTLEKPAAADTLAAKIDKRMAERMRQIGKIMAASPDKAYARHLAPQIGCSSYTATRTIHAMIAQGLVHPELPSNKTGYALTPKGRELYGGERRPVFVAPLPDTPAKPVIVVADTTPKARVTGREATIRMIGDYLVKNRRRRPQGKEIAKAIGFGKAYVASVLREMMRRGLVEAMPKASKSGHHLTLKGFEEFSNGTGPVERAAPARRTPSADRPVATPPPISQLYERKAEPPTPEPSEPAVTASKGDPVAKKVLAAFDDLDLVLEMMERGYIVKRS